MSETTRRLDPALALLSPAERARAAQIGPRDVALLAFLVGGERYAVELHRTREILRARRATPLPRIPAFVEGVIAVRGQVMPLIDLAKRLGLRPQRTLEEPRLVVVAASGGEPAALRVERVLGVTRFRPELVRAPPEDQRFVRAIAEENEVARVLDLDAVLDLSTPSATA